MRKRTLLVILFPAIIFLLIVMYLWLHAARSDDYGKAATEGSTDCPWIALNYEAMSENEQQVFDIYYFTLNEKGCTSTLCKEIAQFYSYYYANSAVTPTIDNVKILNDRIYIHSNGDLYFSFWGSSSIIAIYDMNTQTMIYGIIE